MLETRNRRVRAIVLLGLVALLLAIGPAASNALADKGTGTSTTSSQSAGKPPQTGTDIGRTPPSSNPPASQGAPSGAPLKPVDDGFDKLPPGLQARSISGLVAAGMVHPSTQN